MALLIFMLIGVVVVVIAELLGRLHVTVFDVSRRFKSIAAWRRAQACGIFFLPGVIAFWFIVLLLAGGRSFVGAWSSWTPWTFIFGAAVFILTLCWARLVAFFL